MKRFRLIITFGATFLALGAPTWAQLNRTYFYGEDSFARPIKLSGAILAGLRRDTDFSGCYEYSKDRTEVTEIDPNNDRKAEILVKVGCGNSSTSYLFWLLKKDGSFYSPIFSVGTITIDFMRRRREGFKDILAVGCNANTCFHKLFAFNGRRYVRLRQWTSPNN